MKSLPNIHPGEVLIEEFLTPMGISQNALARAAGVPPRRINEIVLGKRGVTADTAVRLAPETETAETGTEAEVSPRISCWHTHLIKQCGGRLSYLLHEFFESGI